jgi:hypothetical protein
MKTQEIKKSWGFQSVSFWMTLLVAAGIIYSTVSGKQCKNILKTLTMNIHFINEILLIIAVLSTGIVYGTDVFFALIVKKAVKKSDDSSIADLIGWIHLIADKRMPPIGIASLLSSVLFICLNGLTDTPGWLALTAVASLLGHLTIYLTFSKPINSDMSLAARDKIKLHNIRALQQKWDSVISIRAILLTIAMISLLISITIHH